jgi:hypothetical protein
MAHVRHPVASALAIAALLLAACERQPNPDTLKEWTPGDHDRAEEQASQTSQGQPSRGAPPPQAPQGRQGQPLRTSAPQAPASAAAKGDGSDATLIEATWENACAPCHGPGGRGDGPNGPMVNAPDITRPELLSQVTDEEIAAQIRNGKNRMPKFDLPDNVVRGLVARIRANAGSPRR